MDWVPLRYLNKDVDRATLMGLMRLARIGLVTPIRDGMNLVAKEYVAAQDPEQPGVLVLSTMAGAAQELDAAVLVNPYDVDGVAEGIREGLHMSLDERRERHAAMMKKLTRNDITAWHTRFVKALISVRSGAARDAASRNAGERLTQIS
jgi:trehalose 6-phosphate synthase